MINTHPKPPLIPNSTGYASLHNSHLSELGLSLLHGSENYVTQTSLEEKTTSEMVAVVNVSEDLLWADGSSERQFP